MSACQIAGGCPMHAPAAFLLTFVGKPVGDDPGMQWIEGACKAHADVRKGQVLAAGGRLIGVETLPSPPAPIMPTPIGLDAIDGGKS